MPLETAPRPGNEFEPVDPRAEARAVEKDPELCQRARDNLYQLVEAPRPRMRDEHDEVRYLDPEAREKARQQARKAIEIYCK